MSKSMLIIDTPNTCIDCPFRSMSEELYVVNGLYRKISKCQYAPDTIDDPWRDLSWQFTNKEEWCPLKPVEEGSYEHTSD